MTMRFGTPAGGDDTPSVSLRWSEWLAVRARVRPSLGYVPPAARETPYDRIYHTHTSVGVRPPCTTHTR